MELGLDGAGWAQVALTAIVAVGLLGAVVWAGRANGQAPAIQARRLLIAAGVVGGWLAVTGFAAGAGMLRDYDAVPPPMLRVMLPGLALTVAAAFSSFGRSLATGLGWGFLIGFQAFRIPTELMLDALHRTGRLPVQMTFHGANFDILSGISAAAVGWLAARGRIGARGILVWNLAALLLLVNILVIALLSMPGRLRVFANEPANTIVFGWPFVWLPATLVLMALFGHLLVFRRLWAEARVSAQPVLQGRTRPG